MRSLGDSATKGSSLVKAEKEAWTISEVISNAPKAKQKKKKKEKSSPQSQARAQWSPFHTQENKFSWPSWTYWECGAIDFQELLTNTWKELSFDIHRMKTGQWSTPLLLQMLGISFSPFSFTLCCFLEWESKSLISYLPHSSIIKINEYAINEKTLELPDKTRSLEDCFMWLY